MKKVAINLKPHVFATNRLKCPRYPPIENLLRLAMPQNTTSSVKLKYPPKCGASSLNSLKPSRPLAHTTSILPPKRSEVRNANAMTSCIDI